MSRPRGVTLLELLVAMALLGLATIVSVAGFRRTATAPLGNSAEALSRGRRLAIEAGAPVTVHLGDSTPPVLFLPDGTALGSGVDPLDGSMLLEDAP